MHSNSEQSRINGETMCFDAWLKNATPAELERFDRAMAAHKSRPKSANGEETTPLGMSLSKAVHTSLSGLLTNHSIRPRSLAHVLSEKADEIELNLPRDWQVVADAANIINDCNARMMQPGLLKPIQDEFKGATPSADGFEAYAMRILVDALLKKPGQNDDEIPF